MKVLFLIIRRLEEFLLAGGMLLLAALTIANVIARNIGFGGLAFAEEVAQFLIILVCFVGLSYAAGRGRHIRMTALYDQLPARGRKVLMIVIAVSTALAMFALAWLAGRFAWETDTVSPVLRVPLWTVYAVAPLGLVMAGIQFAVAAWRNLTTPGVHLSYDVPDEYQDTGV